MYVCMCMCVLCMYSMYVCMSCMYVCMYVHEYDVCNVHVHFWMQQMQMHVHKSVMYVCMYVCIVFVGLIE